jgi:hypothetical protein
LKNHHQQGRRETTTEANNVLYISTVGKAINSILLFDYLVVGKRIISCVSLVDSGYTGLTFMDFKFAIRNNIPMSRLVKKKPLYLADGVFSSWVEWGAELWFGIGAYQEQLQFYITSMALKNPVILGLLSLSWYDSAIDWKNLWLTFREYCRRKYLPLEGRAQLAPRVQPTTEAQLALRGVKTTPREWERPMGKKKKVRFHMTMEEVEDEGEEQPTEKQPTTCTLESHTLSPAQPAKRLRDQREWR